MSGVLIKKEDAALREIFSQGPFRGEVLFGEPMARHTSLRIGGPADVFAVPSDVGSLRSLMESARRAGVPVYPLGGGTNVLIGDEGLRGIVVSLSAFAEMNFEDDGTLICADAGLQLQKIISYSKKKGLTGVEGLSGIPGTLGGAIAGNAGSYGMEMKDVLREVSVMGLDGVVSLLDARDIEFGYRRAAIPEGTVILSASIKLLEEDPALVSRRVEEYLKQKKAAQPIGERSAGCVFKNPPGYQAGRLMEEAGCKGMREGGVEVSAVHANFFVTKGKAKADDFLRLMDLAADRVRERLGVTLEPEIRVLGCWGAGDAASDAEG